MKLKNYNILSLVIAFLLSVSPSYAKPIDDYKAQELTHLTSTLSEGVKSKVSLRHSTSPGDNLGKTRKVILVPKSGTVEAIIPLFDPNAPKKSAVREDTNQDGAVSPLDALLVINELNRLAALKPGQKRNPNLLMDVNRNGDISPIDVLLVINYLNANRNGRSTVTAGFRYDPSVILLTDKDGGGDVQIVYDGDESNLNSIKYNGLKLNLKAGGADSFLLPIFYSSTNDKSNGKLITIEVFSGSVEKVSKCLIPLPPTTTRDGITKSQYEIKVEYKNCTGNGDFSDVGAIRLTMMGESRGGLDLRLLSFKTNGAEISSAEDVAIPEPSTPLPTFESPPPCVSPCGCDKNNNPIPSGPCGCDLTKVPSGCDNQCGSTKQDLGCGCGEPGPSGCDNQCRSTKQELGCGCGNPGPSGCDNVCGSSKTVDECGVCGGTGKVCGVCGGSPPNSCGGCGMGPFPPEQTPNECGGCGPVTKNECGYCPDDPNKIVKSGCDNQCGSTKVDLGCGCGLPGRSGCDNECGSTKVADACGVCGGNGSSCSRCLFVAGWADVSGYNGVNNNFRSHQDIIDEVNVVRSQPLPSCLYQNIRNKCGCGEGTLNVGSCQSNPIAQGQSVKIWGACLFDQARSNSIACNTGSANLPQCAKYEIDALANLLNVPPHLRAKFSIPSVPGNNQSSSAPYWYFDENCNAVEPPANARVCGYAGYSWSPISLILDEEVNINEDMKVVEFKISAGEKEEFVLWKASSKAPVLVFDPKKTKKVTSAKQLFGNFAFGGKTKNTLDFDQKGLREPWANGYEALGLLDQNDDSKISGFELDDLSLWFDDNRNGISEDGEVREITSSGIKTLYYKDPKIQEGYKDVALDVGFEREVDGELKSGGSVDWFTETFSSKAEAVSSLGHVFNVEASRGRLEDNSDFINSVDEKISAFGAKAKGITGEDPKNLTGYWVWTILEAGAGNNPGIFAITEFVNGKLQAYTVNEAPLGKNSDNIKSAMFMVSGTGSVNRSDLDTKVTMEFKDGQSGGVSKSIAKLSPNGRTLEGETEQSYEVKVGDKVKSARVTYKWIATKTGPEISR